MKAYDVDLKGRLRGMHMLRNWPYAPDVISATNMEDAGKLVVYDRVRDLWMSFGNDGVDMTVRRSYEGRTWRSADNVASLTPNAGTGFSDLVGEYVYIGVTPASSTTKILRSSNYGEGWGPVTLGSADSNGTNAINGSANIGYLATVTNALYRSTSGGSGTWSSVQALGAVYRNIAIRDDSLGVLAVVASVSSSTYYTSTNGTSWTSRTFPSGTVVRLIYNTAVGLFFAVSSNSILYSSSDGINWTSLRDLSTVFDGPTVVHFLDYAEEQLLLGLETPYGMLICGTDGSFNYLEFTPLTFLPAVPADLHVARDRNNKTVQVMTSRFTTTKFHYASLRA